MKAAPDAVEVVDDGGVGKGVAQPCACQRARLGERAHDEQVGAGRKEGQGAFAAEVHICLVHQHDMVGIRAHDALDLRKRKGDAGGRVGVGQHHHAARAEKRLHGHGEILTQGHGAGGHAEQVCKHPVEAVAHRGEGDGMGSVRESEETEPQHLVRAVAAEYVVRRKPICVRDGAAKRQGRGVGVEVEAGDFLAAERVQYAGRGGKGAFVGVELDILAALGLLARHIGVKPGERGNEKIAHERPSMRTATALACASSPSRRAKRMTSSDTFSSAAGV